MSFDLHVYFHVPIEPDPRLDQIITMLQAISKQETKMSQQLDALTAQVTENTNVEASAVTLLQNIAAQLEAAKTDPVKLQALKDQLQNSAAALAAAITANTPAA
jgi:hypothetical protein